MSCEPFRAARAHLNVAGSTPMCFGTAHVSSDTALTLPVPHEVLGGEQA